MNKLMLIWLCLIITSVNAQNYEPLEIAQKIFSKEGLPNVESYLAEGVSIGENGVELAGFKQIRFKLLAQYESTAVINMTCTDTANNVEDAYLHFVKEDNWKLQTIRTLSGFGTNKELVTELASMDTFIDSLLADKKAIKKFPFKTRNDYEHFKQNILLSVSPDDSIVAHYNKHKVDFATLKSSIEQEYRHTKIIEERGVSVDDKWIKKYPQLLVSTITLNDYNVGQGLTFTIGGMLNNSMGYVYFNKSQPIPHMSPERIIMLREIGDGWYIFKTT